jgi:PIN domain nuclease of toxin-antitoxin system
VNLLIDSNVLLWWAFDDRRLNPATVDLLERQQHRVFVSMASLWELAIKWSIGKLQLGPAGIDALTPVIERSGFVLLPIETRHVARVAHLPWHHRYPFDRLIVARAQVEQFTIVTSDATIALYDVTTIAC